MHQMLDAAYFDQTNAAQFVADCRSSGSDSAGLYLANFSASGAGHPAAFAEAVWNMGIGVLPIITPSTDATPSNWQALLEEAVSAWGISNCPLVFDVEEYAEPAASLLDSMMGWASSAGFYVGMYGSESGAFSLYPNAPIRWKWLADYDNVAQLASGYQAKQYCGTCYSGTYDRSVVEDQLTFYRPSGSTSSEEVETMKQLLVYDQTNGQQHFLYLVPIGGDSAVAYHRWYDEKSGTMSTPAEITSTAVSDAAGISGLIMYNGTQLHAFCRWENTAQGTGAHFFLSIPRAVGASESWGTQTI
ncbi:MAG TPA: hypothetical protein VIA06_23100 [Candidatus Dormibacteraeota bacterium]|jgi:hypothetical protein|nr:hypothetical protein [Candidatus Dormibacteraeota bacterium]